MKILQIITLSELGGAQTVVANLSNALVRNHEVIVAAGEGDGKLFDLLDKNIAYEHLPNLIRKLSPIDEIKAILQLRALYKKYNPDIIHLHSSKAGTLGRLAFPAKKIIYTVHGFDSIRLAYRKFLPFEKILQYRASAIVGVSQYDAKNLVSEGITHNVSYVYNGIFQPIGLYQDPFNNIDKRSGIVLCIARVSPQKRLDLFIDVARKLPNYSFVWIGNQEEPNISSPENVTFMGNIPNAGAYIAHADIFMLPSNYEGLPMVIIESLGSGIPVVASNVGGISELLDGSNGMALENNADLMADAISQILSLSKENKKNLHDAALRTFKNQFTVDNMTAGYLQLYNKIIKNI